MEKAKNEYQQVLKEKNELDNRTRLMKENNARQKRLKNLTSKTNVSLAFLLDCTYSMQASINDAKDKIDSIVEESNKRFGGQIKIAFVGYRDYCDSNKIEKLDFTSSVEEFKTFVGDIKASGGGDLCEDVIGGLKEVLDLEWEEGSHRILIHIADAPSHGRRFYLYADLFKIEIEDSKIRSLITCEMEDLLIGEETIADIGKSNVDDYMEDTYKDPKTETPIERIIEDMKNKKISYFFGELNQSTRKMVDEFNKMGGEDFVRCAPVNNISVDYLAAMAIGSVLAQSWDDTIRRERLLNDYVESHVMKIEEKNEVKNRKFKIDKNTPDWETCETKPVKIHTCVIKFENQTSKPTIDWKAKKDTFKIAKNPFARGAEKLAYYCRFESTPAKTMVAKSLIRQKDGRDDKNEYNTMVKLQAISSFYAKAFNKVKSSSCAAVSFLEAKLLQVYSYILFKIFLKIIKVTFSIGKVTEP